MIEGERNIILTGAPGTGKTSVLNLLRESYPCIDEPAREIISEQRSINGNGVSEKNEQLFVELIMSRSIQKYKTVSKLTTSYRFFDRGIPDVTAYASWYKLKLDTFIKASTLYRYNADVFLFSPIKEIYTTDDERKMTFEEVQTFHDLIVSAYTEANYSLVEVPFGSPLERLEFIKSKVEV